MDIKNFVNHILNHEEYFYTLFPSLVACLGFYLFTTRYMANMSFHIETLKKRLSKSRNTVRIVKLQNEVLNYRLEEAQGKPHTYGDVVLSENELNKRKVCDVESFLKDERYFVLYEESELYSCSMKELKNRARELHLFNLNISSMLLKDKNKLIRMILDRELLDQIYSAMELEPLYIEYIEEDSEVEDSEVEVSEEKTDFVEERLRRRKKS